jgi:hypothetical protein
VAKEQGAADPASPAWSDSRRSVKRLPHIRRFASPCQRRGRAAGRSKKRLPCRRVDEEKLEAAGSSCVTVRSNRLLACGFLERPENCIDASLIPGAARAKPVKDIDVESQRHGLFRRDDLQASSHDASCDLREVELGMLCGELYRGVGQGPEATHIGLGPGRRGSPLHVSWPF